MQIASGYPSGFVRVCVWAEMGRAGYIYTTDVMMCLLSYSCIRCVVCSGLLLSHFCTFCIREFQRNESVCLTTSADITSYDSNSHTICIIFLEI